MNMNLIMQYCLSAGQRQQGYTIVEEDSWIELHYKGKRFYSCDLKTELIVIQKEIENHQREFCLEVIKFE